LLLSYVTAAVWCAKWVSPSGALGPARTAIFVYTGVALLGIAALGARGWLRHRRAGAALPHDADSPEDRYGFLGFASLLLCGISAVAVVYQALAALLIGSCR
jgi:hypothetical protein